MIFQTAWNFAGNVILELSRRYPEAVFECKFADEGMQENSGILKIKDGEVFEEKYNLQGKYVILGVASEWTNRKGLLERR